MITKNKKLTLQQTVSQLLEKSNKVKSVFSQMKIDLEDTNSEISTKVDEIEFQINSLKECKSSLNAEKTSNENVIKNIDNMLK